MIRPLTLLLVGSLGLAAQAQSSACKPYDLVKGDLYLQTNPRIDGFEESHIWKVTPPGDSSKVSYIVGTLHTDNREVVAQHRLLIPLLAEVDGYISETQHSPTENVSGLIDSDTPISELLEPELAALYAKRVKQSRLPFEMLNTKNVWYNFSLLSRPKASKFSMEKMLLDASITLGKYHSGLQTNADIAQHLNSVGEPVLLDILKEVVCSYEVISEQNQIQIQAYNSGDLTGAYNAGHIYHSQSPTRYQAFMDAVVFERNLIITEKLKKAMASRSYLAAFGFSHLLGERGVLNGLQKAGFNLTPVNLAEVKEFDDELGQRALKKLTQHYLPFFNRFLRERKAFDIPEGSELFPTARFVTQSALQDEICEGTPCPIFGVYDSDTIRLAYSMIPAILQGSPNEVGIVFHEYIHFVQEEFGTSSSIENQTPTQWALREREAKLLQLQFVHWISGGSSL